MPEKQSTVYIVQNDKRKDFSDAERFGQLRDIFGNAPRTYNPPRMLAHARRVLKNWQPGDYLLMAGDPTLCGIAMIVVAEQFDEVDVLRWDRVDYQYTPQNWDLLGIYDEGYTDEGSDPHNLESEN